MSFRYLLTLATLLTAATTACGAPSRASDDAATEAATMPAKVKSGAHEVATFAGGCFWCMEPAFEHLDGVIEVVSGFTGGAERKPSYEQVSMGSTGHTEAVQVTYDPSQVSYETLLEVYWKSIDPTDAGGQFADRGSQYRPGIFYHDEAQHEAAQRSKAAIARSGRFSKPIVVEITAYQAFYPAEQYHQDYYKKNATSYKRYRKGSGRTGYLDRVWQDLARTHTAEIKRPSDEWLHSYLSPLQYRVTQQEGTEPPFRNAYWDNKQAGIYVDIVSGEPLFSSQDKFASGTGWPSFTRPLLAENVVEGEHNRSIGGAEVRSLVGDSHLGHVFPDGPPPTGNRYCINSAALRFIPVDAMVQAGYGDLVDRFTASTE